MKEPKIRFKGFDGKWENFTLKDICEINPKSTLPNVFEYVDLESVVGTEMIFHRTERKGSAPSRAQRLAQKGDIFYQTVRPYQKNNYLFDKDDINYVFSTGYAQLRTKIDSGYLFTLMQSSPFVNRVLLECTGTSYPAINPTNLSKIKVYIVDNKNIQRNIAAYFKHLDSLIQSTTKKIESLKQVKVASLQSMFPQEGETKPRVRFKGFDGNWEKVHLGEICEEIKRKAEPGSNAPVMMISASQGFINQSEKYSSDNAGSSLSNYTLLKKGELSYNHGYSKIRNYGSCFSLEIEEARVPFVYHSFKLKQDCSLFFAVYLNSGLFDKKLRKIVSSTARMDGLLNISYESYVSLEVMKPSIIEQQKIADYFTAIDQQITLQTQRLEKLKQMKSACLDNMFV